jgi:hypothetical protein
MSPSPSPPRSGDDQSDRRTGFSFAVSAAWWLCPVVLLLWLYHDALATWFVADDFAWLSLLRHFRERHDLLHELFAPMAQGTIRPLSERGYFMLLEGLFGLDSLPFRVVAFVTAAADTLLIAWITRRLNGLTGFATGSRLAGLTASVLWAANTALVRPMTWSSSYNELLCPLFLLTSLALFIRYIDTGQRKFWWWQLVVFSLGFGALEINIVYPAIAAAWVLFDVSPARRTRLLRGIAPLAGISVAYFLLHRIAAPMPASGPYAMRFNYSMLRSLAFYWEWALTPEAMQRFGYSRYAADLVFLTGSLAIAGFVAAELRRRRRAVLFCLSWFAVTVAPLLPLTSHREDYYLTIPFIGIAMLGGLAVSYYSSGSSFGKRALIIAVPVAAYLWAMVTLTLVLTNSWRAQSLAVRTLVLGVVAARRTHPGKAIVLDGVTTELFDLSLAHSPFVAAGVDNVYITPESALTIKQTDSRVDLELLSPAPEALWHGITNDEVVVYSLESDRLRNITESYARHLASRLIGRLPDGELPARIDVGNFLYSWLLGPQWLPSESGIRWMPGSASLRIGVPPAGNRLELDGLFPRSQLSAGARHLMVLVDGVVAAETRIYDPETNFRRLFSMPGVLAGRKTVNLEIRVDPVGRMDGQDYGLIFGKVAIRP